MTNKNSIRTFCGTPYARICAIAAICPAVKVLILKCFGYGPWPFKVTWRYRSCKHIRLVQYYAVFYTCSIDCTDPLSWPVFEILTLKYIWIATLTLRVTWRHRSRDHTIRYIRFPMGALLELTQILSRSFSRSRAISIQRTKKLRCHVPLTTLPFRKFFRGHVRRDCPWVRACQIWVRNFSCFWAINIQRPKV